MKVFTAVSIGLLSAVLTMGARADGGSEVPVGRFDATGTGANLKETTLNTSNVNPSRFGKLFSYELEGFVYAQPLIVSDIQVRGRRCNALNVATTNNVVYALDADDPGPDGGLLWQVRLAEHGVFPVPGTIEARK